MEKKVYKSASETLLSHSSAPCGCLQVCRTPLPISPWRLCCSSLSSTRLLWSSKEQLVRKLDSFFLSLPVKPRFCLFVSNKIMAFFETYFFPDVEMTWSSSLPSSSSWRWSTRGQNSTRTRWVRPLLFYIIYIIYLDFWDIFCAT